MGDIENLVLEHLRAIRGDIASIKDEQRTMRAEISALRQENSATRQHMGAMITLQEQCLEDIAKIRLRLERIERRLDLVDAP